MSRLLILHDFLREFTGVNLSKALEIKKSTVKTLNHHTKAGENQNASAYLYSLRYNEGLILNRISTDACKTVILDTLQLRQTGEICPSCESSPVSQDTSLLFSASSGRNCLPRALLYSFFLKDEFLNRIGARAAGL